MALKGIIISCIKNFIGADKMKKIISFAGAFCLSFAVFAAELPTGQNVSVRDVNMVDGRIVSAVLPNPVEFETSIGKISSTANKKVEFYENGSLKKIYSEENVVFKGGENSVKLKSPYEFYDSGELKSAKISYVSEAVILKTPVGNLEAIRNAEISFFKDGSVESFKVSQHNKQVPFNLKGGYKDLSVISFYESGNVKQLTPNVSNLYKGLGINLKANTEICFYDGKRVKSFIPDDGAVLKSGEKSFPLVKDKELELFEDGSVKKMAVDCAYSDFKLGGIPFIYATVAGSLQLSSQNASALMEFYESGVLKSVDAIYKNRYVDEFPVVALINDNIVSANRIEFSEAGKPVMISFFAPVLVGAEAVEGDSWSYKLNLLNSNYFSNIKPRTESMYYYIWRIYSPENSAESYCTGREIDDSESDYFYTKETVGIITVRDKKITAVSGAKNLSAFSDLIFDETGKLSGYTAKNEEDKTVFVPLQK